MKIQRRNVFTRVGLCLMFLRRQPKIPNRVSKANGQRPPGVSDDGRCGFAGGLQDAKDIAIKQCGNVAKGGCRLYAVDDAVIWKESIAGQGGAAPAGR